MASLLAAGIGLASSGPLSAAPVNGAAINAAADALALTEPVHCRRGWYHHRRGSWDGCSRYRYRYDYRYRYHRRGHHRR
jgi:hypothetical protein